MWSQHAHAAAAWLAAHPEQRAKSASLTAMAESVLGKPLNKALQTSNWEARPLSPQQLHYAALDAHVCLQICNAVYEQAGLSANRLQEHVTTWRQYTVTC